MVSEVEQLEQELAAAKKRLKDSKDISYCTVDKIRLFANHMERTLSLRPGDEDSLERRLENIMNSTHKMSDNYSAALWADDNRNGRC